MAAVTNGKGRDPSGLIVRWSKPRIAAASGQDGICSQRPRPQPGSAAPHSER